MQDLISVIIPVYNGEKYIQRCINSILSQTYPSLEIIAVNDGSTDGTADILDAMAAADSRVKPIHQPNSGAAAARLCGIQHAGGAYLSFVDSDDYLESNMLQRLYDLLQDGDYQIACCQYKSVYENRPAKYPQQNGSLKVYTFAQAIKNLYHDNLWSVWGKLYRRELFDTDKLLSAPLRVSEDLLLVYSLMKQCRQLVLTQEPLYCYFRHSASVMAEPLSETRIRDSMKAYRMIEQDLDKNSEAYVYHIQNLLSNDFGFLNSIILKNTCQSCYRELRREILSFKKYAFINNGSPAINKRHKLGVVLLQCCPPLFNLAVKLKG